MYIVTKSLCFSLTKYSFTPLSQRFSRNVYQFKVPYCSCIILSLWDRGLMFMSYTSSPYESMRRGLKLPMETLSFKFQTFNATIQFLECFWSRRSDFLLIEIDFVDESAGWHGDHVCFWNEGLSLFEHQRIFAVVHPAREKRVKHE